MKNLISFLVKILVINFFIGFSGANADDVLKIYSERQPMLIEPLLNEFESAIMSLIFILKVLINNEI